MRAEELLALCKQALSFYRSVYEFRDDDGGMPFGTCDYYEMEDFMKKLDGAIKELEANEFSGSKKE